MAKLLEIHDLRYRYGNIPAIKGVSLHVDEGEIVTLIGANGAGKTTIMHTICSFNDSRGASGEVLFGGKPILKVPAHKIARMGLSQVVEGRRIFPDLTVAENLGVGGYLRKDKAGIESDMKAMFQLFPRLEERKKQLGGTLSGGEQQMLAIARALMSNPKMLLLDEPSLGLAPLIIHEIFQAIRKIASDGTTVLFVEQNTKVALNTASRAYVIQTGEIMLQGSSESLLNNEDIQKIFLGMHREEE